MPAAYHHNRGGGRGGGGGRQQTDPSFRCDAVNSGGGRQQHNDAGYRGGGSRGRGARGRGGGPSGNSGYGRQTSGICTNFTMTGNCRFGSNCWYQHTLRNVGLQPDAHDDFIYCAAVGAAPPTPSTPPGVYEIYTGGKDQKVKRWLAIPDQTIGPTSAGSSLLPADAVASNSQATTDHNPVVKFTLRLDATTPFESGVTSLLLAADCLFCGLHNGTIRGFHRPSSAAFHLVGHTKEVQALGLIDGILISGDFGGELRFWKPEVTMSGSPNFVCAQKLLLPSPIRCLRDVLRSPGADLQTKFLWVGCVNHIVIVDLLTLSIAHTHNLGDLELGETPSGAKDICMDILIFQNTVLCGCSSGNIVCCSIDGPELQRFHRLNKGIMSMTGIVAATGPQLVLGSRRGFFDFISLPTMKHVSSFQPHDENIRALVAVDPRILHPGSNSPPWFVSVSEDRCIALWQMI